MSLKYTHLKMREVDPFLKSAHIIIMADLDLALSKFEPAFQGCFTDWILADVFGLCCLINIPLHLPIC